MKVFISQPMNGIDYEEIFSKRSEAINKIKEKFGDDVEIINSIYDDYVTQTGDIPLMADADYAYFVDGYDRTREERAMEYDEYSCCKNYGIRNNID